MINPVHILISRTDSIGDVILTLPLCAAIKEKHPNVKLSFLGKAYTQAIIESYTVIDQFIDYSDLEKKPKKEQITTIKQLNIDTVIHVFPNKEIGKLCKEAEIINRIGTSHRLHHWINCNIRPNFTRKNADLHEAQLNYKLASPLGINTIPTFDELISSTSFFKPKNIVFPREIQSFLDQIGKYVILHPKSQGSALEWPIDKYMQTAKLLVKEGYKVIFTGTEKEGLLFRSAIPNEEFILDSTGKLSLIQLIALINEAKGLVACSTGPLHIAAFCGIKAIGLYSSRRPIHPGRWKPIGKQARALVFNPNCKKCANGEVCHCIENIPVSEVILALK